MACPDEASLRLASGAIPPVPRRSVVLRLGIASSNAENIEEADQWQEFRLESGTKECIRVGRAKDNDLPISTKGVSAYHLEFRLAETPQDGPVNGEASAGVAVCDISTNGTAVKLGETVERLQKDVNTPVADGASLVFPWKIKAENETDKETGRAYLFVRIGSDAAQVPLALSTAAPTVAVSAAPLQPPQQFPMQISSASPAVQLATPAPVSDNGTAPSVYCSVSKAAPSVPAEPTAFPKSSGFPPANTATSPLPPGVQPLGSSLPGTSVPPSQTAPLVSVSAVGTETAPGVAAFVPTSPGTMPAPMANPMAATGMPFGATTPGAGLPGMPMMPGMMGGMPGAAPDANAMAMLMMQNPAMAQYYAQMQQLQLAQAQAQMQQALLLNRPPLAVNPPPPAFGGGASTFGGAAPQSSSGSVVVAIPENLKDKEKEIDALCDTFGLDHRSKDNIVRRLTKRLSTFEEDIESLHEVLKEARNPPALLTVKLKQMDDGSFTTRTEVKARMAAREAAAKKLADQKAREEAAALQKEQKEQEKENNQAKESKEENKEEATEKKENEEEKENKEEKEDTAGNNNEDSAVKNGADAKETNKGASGKPPHREGMRPGDWICPKCDFLNFARNKDCRKCGEKKPLMEGESDRKASGGRASPHRKYDRRRSRSRERRSSDRRRKRSRSRSRRRRSRSRSRSRRRSRSRKRRSPSRKRGRSKSRKRSRSRSRKKEDSKKSSRSRSRSEKKDDKKAKKSRSRSRSKKDDKKAKKSRSRSSSNKKDDKKAKKSRSRSSIDKKDDKKAKKSRSRSRSDKKDEKKTKKASRSASRGEKKEEDKDIDKEKKEKKKKEAKSSSSSSSS